MYKTPKDFEDIDKEVTFYINERKEENSFDDYLTECILKEQKRIEIKKRKFIYNYIIEHSSPYELKNAFSNFNNFIEFIDKLEEGILQTEEWYTL